jgi:uncharacterized integral membrane protein
MKTKISFIFGLITLTLLLLILSNDISAQPKVFMSETSWDLGIIPQGSVISHTYWIKNIGTDTLRILKVRPG